MDGAPFKMSLCLPAQGASEVDATIIEWHVAEGDRFAKGQPLAQIDSAKSVFEFESPCDGVVVKLYHQKGETVAITDPVIEIETSDAAMRDWIPPATGAAQSPLAQTEPALRSIASSSGEPVCFLGFGGYLPNRVVTNEEIVRDFPEITPEYIYQVTGIRQRRWAAPDEKPSDMAYKAALDAIRQSGIAVGEIDAVIVATTTPDAAMPSTAAILQHRLNLQTVPAFDVNAACAGWLYASSIAHSMILSGAAQTVLTVGVDRQSQLLNKSDRSAYFLFGDGAGAAILSSGRRGHPIHQTQLGADTHGLHMARRDAPGYLVPDQTSAFDPWIRIDGQALFRFATESFAKIIPEAIAKTGWRVQDLRWIVPHQANGRIIKAAARRSGIDLGLFYLNVEQLGNTSSASVPLAMTELESKLQTGDKLILCAVGAGMTTAAVSMEW